MDPKYKTRYTRSNPDRNPPAIFENPNLISNNLRSQDNRENPADLNLDTLQQNLTQSELTLGKAAALSTVAAASSSSPSSPQSIFSSAPSTTLISVFVPVLPAIPFIPTNMENRYAPL